MSSSSGRILRVRAAMLAALMLPASSLPAADPSEVEPSVRRWEYVMLVRVRDEVPSAPGLAETAAFRAGAAVLESVRSADSDAPNDWRYLLRLRDKDRLPQVLREVRAQPGVVGVSAVPLPETPTMAGGPSFMASYTAGLGGDDDDHPGVLVHHDVPPVLDKRDLLETTHVPAGPGIGPDAASGAGGVGFNVSDLWQKLRAGSWRRREQKMRETPLNILPPAAEPSGSP